MPLLKRKGLFETGKISFLAIDQIRPNPNQPRTRFSTEGLEELAQSIGAHGILQPLSVRKVPEGYELVSGERRLRAAQMAGLTQVPCLLVHVDDATSSLLALVENLQRRDLDFLEEARALESLLSTFHLSQEEVAQRIGKSQSAVANKLRLLKLPPQVLTDLQTQGFSERHARALLKLPQAQLQTQAAAHLIANRLTVAKTEAYVESLLAPPPPKRPKPILLLNDVRLFLNTITRGLTMMNDAGVPTQCDRTDTDQEILLTIRIPKTQS